MPNINSVTKSLMLSLTALLLTITAPAGALISTVSAADCAPENTPGVNHPTGAEGVMYTYQCDGPYANKWVSPYYIYENGPSGARTPLYSLNYKYDCTSGVWTRDNYVFDATDSSYHYSRTPATDPGLATDCPVAVPSSTSAAGGGGAAAAANTTNSGTGSDTSTSTDVNNTTNLSNTTVATMNNQVTGVATTGNSLVLDNRVAGNAATGNAYNQADIVNMLQSSSNTLGSDGNTIIFTKDIDGDVNGDLFLDPNQLSRVQNAGAGSDTNADGSLNNKVNINNSTSASINNNIDLNSTSGNATVAGNRAGGDATTGNAKAVANIVNTINASLMAGHSFIGTININGNLNGDILLPENFVDQLIAANTPTVTITAPGSDNSSNTNVNSNTNINNTNNLGIDNNINTTSTTGTANISDNRVGGNATTGNATTNITAFNLTGSKVVGKNSILVFVNAPGGKWVGIIVNAPQGSTAAALGGGITNSGAGSDTSNNTTIDNDATINNTNDLSIKNNINVKANSGNAAVNQNRVGGNATSGDADTRVNLANVENTTLDLSGWLGILFINVFGTWNGSFGINTSAGDPIAAAASQNAAATAGTNGVPQVFNFVPSTNSTESSSNGSGSGSGSGSTGSGSADNSFSTSTKARTSGAVLAAAQINGNSTPTPQINNASQSNLGRTLAIIAIFTVFYIAMDAFVTSRNARIARHKRMTAATQTIN